MISLTLSCAALGLSLLSLHRLRQAERALAECERVAERLAKSLRANA